MRKFMKWLKQIWERLVGDGVPGYFNYAEIRKAEQKKRTQHCSSQRTVREKLLPELHQIGE